MKLVLPDTKYKDSFLAALEESHRVDPRESRERYDSNVEEISRDFDAYVRRQLAMAQGRDLPENYVAQTTYWLVDGYEYLGNASIRHELTDELLKVGGHIGYFISPFHRKKGYGKKILALALEKAKEFGISKALVTCNEDNIGSKKIIEANGGVLENSVEMGEGKPRKLRYWITIK